MANLYKKEDLVARVAEKMGTPKTKAKETVETVIDAVKELIVDETHDGVDVFGFAKFEVRQVPERIGRNPKTSETITIPAHDQLKCKLSSAMKNLVK